MYVHAYIHVHTYIHTYTYTYICSELPTEWITPLYFVLIEFALLVQHPYKSGISDSSSIAKIKFCHGNGQEAGNSLTGT